MKVVLDTNVVVSGLLSPYGAPAEIVRLVADGDIHICYDGRILAEYRQVLLRPVFGFAPSYVRALLDQMQAAGQLVSAWPLAVRLPDPDDEAFLAVALAGPAECLITGNPKHYPVRARQGMRIESPASFVRLLGSQAPPR